jgi:hypothetical protein
MQNDRDTMVFIHGFNVTFIEALEAGALLAADLPVDPEHKTRPNLVVFSWPSDGLKVPFMSYYSDHVGERGQCRRAAIFFGLLMSRRFPSPSNAPLARAARGRREM